MEKLTFCLYADLHYKKGMYIPAVSDMSAILERAQKADAAFCIHCGDFCNDYSRSPELVHACLRNPECLPTYGVYGNHELESAGNSMELVTPLLCNRPVTWGTDSGTIEDGQVAYYYFDTGAFRIIGLDTNYSLTPDGTWEHNHTCSYGPPAANTCGNALGPVQLAWLKTVLTDAAEAGKHCLLFSHASFAGNWGMSPDGEAVQALFRQANAQKPGTVIAAFNGHYHTDHAAVVEDVVYIDVNTVRNNLWLPVGNEHYTTETFAFTSYDECGTPIATEQRRLSTLSMAKNTWFSDAPLSAIVTVTTDGVVTVDGTEANWYGGIVPETIREGKGPRITSGTYAAGNMGKRS